MSMIHGVEIRVPFLENNLINYVKKINEKIKYEGIMPKQFLIDSFKNQVPNEIWNRPKMGFSFPFAKWMSNSNYIKQISSNNNNPLHKNYKKFLDGTLHWSQMMSLILLNHNKV
jgi:asparagine synthase (glutamine-hydrolysing)